MELLLAVGCVTAGLALLAPGFAMCLARSVVRYAPYSYALALPSSFLWCAYGVKHDMTALCLLSAGGAAIQVLYLVLFFRRAPADDDRRGCAVRLLLLGALAVVVGAVAYFVVDTSREVEYGAYGWWCCFVASFAALSPFMNWPAVRDMWETRTMRRMPPWIVPALALPNALVWMLRNRLSHDWPGITTVQPAIAGFITALVSLVLVLLHLACCMMGQPPPRIDDELNEPLIVNGHQQDPSLPNNQLEEPANPLPNNQQEPVDPLPNNEEPAANPPLPMNNLQEPAVLTPTDLDEIVVEDPAARQEKPEEAKDKLEIEKVPPQEINAQTEKVEINVRTEDLKDKIIDNKDDVEQASEPEEEDVAPKPQV